MGVEGESIFGKYLWRVETTELEKGRILSLSLSPSLSLSVPPSLLPSLYSWSAGCLFRDPNTVRGRLGKSRGSVGVIESVIRERWSGMLIPAAADASSEQEKTYVIVAIPAAASSRVSSSLSCHRSRSPKVRNLRFKLFRSCKG